MYGRANVSVEDAKILSVYCCEAPCPPDRGVGYARGPVAQPVEEGDEPQPVQLIQVVDFYFRFSGPAGAPELRDALEVDTGTDGGEIGLRFRDDAEGYGNLALYAVRGERGQWPINVETREPLTR